MSDFLRRLEDAVKNFDLETAETLSNDLHQAEDEGYVVSREEENLWFRITTKIVGKRIVKTTEAGGE